MSYHYPEAKGLPETASTRQKLQEAYDGFAARGVKLDLTRGKPSTAQLDLSTELLSLPWRGVRAWLASTHFVVDPIVLVTSCDARRESN